MRVHHVLHGTIEMMARMHVIQRDTFTLLRYVAQRELLHDYVA